MNKDSKEELIQQYLDLSLSIEKKIAFEKELEIDSDTREELLRYKKLWALFEEESACEIPKNYTDSLMAKLPNLEFSKPKTEVKVTKPRFVLASLGSLAIASIAMFFVFKQSQPIAEFERPNSIENHFELAINYDDLKPNTKEDESIDSRRGPGYKVTKPSMKLIVDKGVVKVKRKNGQIESIRKGEEGLIYFADQIETGYHTNALVVWPEDEVQLKLKPRSRVQVTKNSIRLYHGDSWVNVIKKGMHFEVQTPNLVAAVRGTIFATNVRYSTYGIQLDLFDNLVNEAYVSDALNYSESQLERALVFASQVRGYDLNSPQLKTSEVNVFEGVVEVSSLGSDEHKEMLFSGDSVSETRNILSSKQDIDPKTFMRWKGELDLAGVAFLPNDPDEVLNLPINEEELELKHEILPADSFDQDFKD